MKAVTFAPLLVRNLNGRAEWTFAEEVAGCDLRIVATQGRGLGVIAARDFAAGERIIAEAPLATLIADDRAGDAVFARAVRQLSPEKQVLFWKLMQNESRYGVSPKTARGVWLSNAYPLPAGADGRKVSA